MEFPIDCPLTSMMQNYLALFENIKKKCLERLKFEEMEKDEKLTNPKS